MQDFRAMRKRMRIFKQESRFFILLLNFCCIKVLGLGKYYLTMALIENAVKMSAEVSPLELCLPEIWYHEIFPKLHTVEEKIAIYNTCTLFRDLLEDSKHVWMLPAVLPHIFKYLDTNSALTIRRVCNKWSNSLDEHLDSLYKDEFTYFNEYSKTFKTLHLNPDPSRLEEGYVLHNVTGVRALLRKMGNVEQPMKSLPGGKLVVRLWYHPFSDDDDMIVEFLSGLVDILEAVGRSIRYFDLSLSVAALPQRIPIDGWLYRNLLKCLVELPNLRFLKLSVPARINYLDINTNNNANRHLDIVEAMRMYPLPLTPRLEHFEPSRFIEKERTPILDHLFTHYTRAPIMWNWVGQDDLFRGLPLKSLGTLKELFYQDEENGESIRRFPAPRLTTLRLQLFDIILDSMQMSARWSPVDVTRLLESLHNLFPSMENLSIECIGRRGFTLSPPPGNITFPSVTTLRLMVHGEISYNFLRCFPSLERFYVTNDYLNFRPPQQFPLTEAEHETRHWFHFECLDESQAWVALPNLKLISFTLHKQLNVNNQVVVCRRRSLV